MRYCKPASLASCFFNLRLSLLSFHFSLGQTHSTQLVVCCWHPTALATNLYINQTHISQGAVQLKCIACWWLSANDSSSMAARDSRPSKHACTIIHPTFLAAMLDLHSSQNCEPRICFNGFCYDIELRFLRLLNCHSSPGGWPLPNSWCES